MSDAMALRLVSSTHEPVAAVGRGIRRYVRILLENWGLGAEIVEDALVVVEELVAMSWTTRVPASHWSFSSAARSCHGR